MMMMMMMSRLVMFARSYSYKQSRACWRYALMNSSVLGSRRNEDGRWQRRSGTAGREFHMDGPATAKLRGPQRTVLVAGTARSPRRGDRRRHDPKCDFFSSPPPNLTNTLERVGFFSNEMRYINLLLLNHLLLKRRFNSYHFTICNYALVK